MIALPPKPESFPLIKGQYTVLVDEHDTDVVCHTGGWGCGKTEGVALFALDEGLTYDDNYIAVAAATIPQLRRSTIRKTLTLFNRLGVNYRFWKQEKRLLLKDTGSEIEFLSCHIPPEEQQGPEFGALAIEEAEGVSEAHFKALVSRVRKPDASRKIRIACNPPHRSHWVTRLFWEDPAPGWKLVQSTTYENGFLTEQYIRRLEHLYGYQPGKPVAQQPLMWRRYMNGELGLPVEGAIYPELSDHDHVIDLATFGARYGHRIVGHCCGFDFGGNHPTAFVQAALTDDDILIVTDAYRQSHMPIDKHLENIWPIYKGGPVWSDHQMQDRIEYELRGLDTRLAPKWVGVEQGLEAVRRRLLTNQLLIVRETCGALYDEFQTYMWAQQKTDGVEYKDRPVKLNDDLMDALRYMVTGLDQAVQGDGDYEVLRQVFAG